MKKLMLAVPSSPEGAVDAHLVEWLLSVRAEGWEIMRTLVRNKPVVQARNKLVKAFLETDADVLLTIDSDQIPQLSADDKQGGLDLLLEAIDRDDVDIVNAITVRSSTDGPVPVINKSRPDSYKCDLHIDILKKPTGLHELGKDGLMGAAAIMVKRHVLERFWNEDVPWFMDVFVDKKGTEFSMLDGRDLFGERLVGHDYWFFMRAHEFGFRSWVDTRVFWGHVKPCDMRSEYLRDLKLMKRIDKLEAATA